MRRWEPKSKRSILVTGQYDIVVIFEAKDNATAAKALATGSLGNVKTETFLAFTEDEYHKIIEGLP